MGKDEVILRDAIEILLNELYCGGYIPSVADLGMDDEVIVVSPVGLNKLYLDFRFLMVTLHNFMNSNAKTLCTSICEKAKVYVEAKYNLQMEVDWKMMHTTAMKLQYTVLTGDELGVLNKSYIPVDVEHDGNAYDQPAYSTGRQRNGSRRRTSSVKNKNNPFLNM